MSSDYINQPRPALPELIDSLVLQVFLKLREGAESIVDRARQIPVRLAAPIRAHPLPEERVVVVPSAVVAERGLLVAKLAEVLEHLLDGLVNPLGPLDRRVDLVHVSLMMLVVVQPHRGLV